MWRGEPGPVPGLAGPCGPGPRLLQCRLGKHVSPELPPPPAPAGRKESALAAGRRAHATTLWRVTKLG